LASRAWVDGYDSVARRPYLDFGDAARCPPVARCAAGWTIGDVWYVAWGARGALSVPEIYGASGVAAEQWQYLSLWSRRHHGVAMTIVGVASQRGACQQFPQSFSGIDTPPRRAWTMLARALNADRRTAQVLLWSTDIRWGP